MTVKCPGCGADMNPKKPCPECGHEINGTPESLDGINTTPKVPEEDLTGGVCKDGKATCDKCGKDGCKGPKKDGIKAPKVVEEDLSSPKCDKCGKAHSTEDACKPKGKTDSVDRIDYWGDLNAQATMSEALETTENGALIGKAPIFGVGVYRYMGADGKVTAEFRPPESVFSKETLESYELLPLTLGHPTEKVTPENYKKYVVGNLGEEIETDAYNAYAEMVIHDSEAIAAVKAGLTGLSCGYSCDVVTEGTVSFPVMDWEGKEIGRTTYQVPGNWNGTPYDAIQINNRGNHVSLVPVPRGGDALHLRFDGADVGVGVRISETQPTPTNQKESHMAKIKLDGQQEHEIPEAVKIHLDSLDAKVASLEAEKSKLQAKADSASEALEAVKAEAKAKEDGFQAKLDAAISARMELVSLATKHGVKADGSDAEIKGALIAKAFPKANMDGKDEAYVAARLDAALELLDSGVQHLDGVQSQLQQIQPKPTEDKVDGSDWGAYQASFRK